MVYDDIVRALNRQKVDYLVAGGVALVMHGVVRLTADFDIMVDFGDANLRRLLAAMKELGLRPRAPVRPEDLLDPLMRAEWADKKNMVAFSFHNPSKPLMLVDVLLRTSIDYAKLKAGADRMRFGRLTASVVSARDLIRLKEATGREQDTKDAKALRGLMGK